MCPQEGVLPSLGVDVYVRGNSTWMGLCVRACMSVCVYELKCMNVHQVTCVLYFFLLFFLCVCAEM